MIASDYNPLHLDFNLSHCEGFAVVVICRGRLCGIDLEKLVPYESTVHIQAALSEAGGPVVESGKLLSAWTQREALLKAIGTGWRGANQPMDSSAWNVTCVEPFEGFIASLAVEVNLSPENISSYIY